MRIRGEVGYQELRGELRGLDLYLTRERIRSADTALLDLNNEIAALAAQVDGLHARLVHLEGGQFIIRDEGSVAGTWVNYAPDSGDGVTLRHGDLIHIGRISFRFTQREGAKVGINR